MMPVREEFHDTIALSVFSAVTVGTMKVCLQARCTKIVLGAFESAPAWGAILHSTEDGYRRPPKGSFLQHKRVARSPIFFDLSIDNISLPIRNTPINNQTFYFQK